MTREETVRNLLTELIDMIDNGSQRDLDRADEICTSIIQTLEQEPKAEQFAEWVAREIFDEDWEYNKDAFAELACRKLAKLGIVRASGDEWKLVEPQESEVDE
jgi:hypothetical protein